MDYSGIPCIEIASEVPMPKARKTRRPRVTEDVSTSVAQDQCYTMIAQVQGLENTIWEDLQMAAAERSVRGVSNAVSALKHTRNAIHELEYLAHLV